jgi:membrane protein YdbS with pleckstrin-like domain
MRTILVIAWICLILSITVNVLSFINTKLLDSLDGIVMLLHGGIFLVFVPLILRIKKGQFKFSKDRKHFWSQALRYCPGWMRNIIGLSFLYGFTSFLLSWFFAKNPNSPWWPFSSMWIIAYSLGIGTVYSSILSRKAEPPLAKDKD